MKYIAIPALLLTLSVTAVCAQQTTVKMTFSGTSAPSTINLLQPNTTNDEDNFAGNSPLGSFTARNIRALPNSSTRSSSCSGPTLLHFTESVGGSVLRFQDNSLLFLSLTQGSDCIDLSTGQADCVLTFQITGGTGHLKNASGTLTMTETALPVLSDATGNPVFYAATGEFTGTISRVAIEEQRDDPQ
jgi:hypothetical protein